MRACHSQPANHVATIPDPAKLLAQPSRHMDEGVYQAIHETVLKPCQLSTKGGAVAQSNRSNFLDLQKRSCAWVRGWLRQVAQRGAATACWEATFA